MVDPETIVDAIADGLAVPEAVHRFGLDEREIRTILKRATERCYDGAYMREAWMLEERRLAAVGLKYYQRAMEGDGDPQAAIIFIKASERRATLRGANSPVGHAVTIMHQAAEPQLTSTKRIRLAVDAVKGITPEHRAQMDAEEDAKWATSEPPEDKRSEIEQALDRLRGKD
jgi:hypothetical protein